MTTGVIISTYNAPDLLELTLEGFRHQDGAEFEIVVADDGSTPENIARIEAVAAGLGLALRHVWHEDEGFRKCAILNRAIEASSAEYLIFTDGDCIPRRDFVETHRRLRRPGRFLSGGYFKLSREASRRLSVDDVRSGRAFEPAFLAGLGVRGWRRARLGARGAAARFLDRLTPTGPTWNGHNASGWRQDLVRANGFDERMRYGGEDRELGERLENAGVRGLQLRHRAICLHQWHERGYVREEHLRANREIRDRTQRDRTVRTRWGIRRETL